MRVRYIGSDDPTDNAACTAFGATFVKGEWVEMADVPPRLLTNWTFETAESKPKRGKVEAEAEVRPPE